jgi:hypothetical protein
MTALPCLIHFFIFVIDHCNRRSLEMGPPACYIISVMYNSANNLKLKEF